MYPPKHHLEHDQEKIYQTIESFPFATLIAKTEDDVHVTHIPLILNRERKVLIGHMDKNNPHAQYLDGHKATAIFHGPQTYISPSVYASSQLPTWNYINVHVKGAAALLESKQKILESIIAMNHYMEPDNSSYLFDPSEKRVDTLLDYIVGFEISMHEMLGRFKLSQDKSSVDTNLAKEHLIKQDQIGNESFIHFILS